MVNTVGAWLDRIVEVANDFGLNITLNELLNERPDITGHVTRVIRRPHGNITEVFFKYFDTEDLSQDDVIAIVIALNEY